MTWGCKALRLVQGVSGDYCCGQRRGWTINHSAIHNPFHNIRGRNERYRTSERSQEISTQDIHYSDNESLILPQTFQMTNREVAIATGIML
ncbi:hypothetical protein RRG08_004923 [Elysia crispata]|uniref:Uncharacterized protein n=1 Tax=Elysia crispata TaxID=231223 RepID=A0AAE0ZIS3_9GAST|nr:hypothetical protein RRG08_004923 [Elysia crispata]